MTNCFFPFNNNVVKMQSLSGGASLQIMRIVLLSIIGLYFSIAVFAHDNAEPVFLKTFVPAERVHDFGDIEERNGKVSHVFIFRNTGIKPVVVSEANAFCSCTEAEFTYKPIQPGQTTAIKVTYNPYNRPGTFSKEIVVILNNGKNYVRCWVKGNVIGYDHPVEEDYPNYLGAGLYSNLKVIAFVSQGMGRSQIVELKLANDTDSTMRITFTRQPDNKVLKMPSMVELKPKERKVLKTSYAYPKAYTYNRSIMLNVEVNGKRVKPIKVSLLGSKPRYE